MTKTSENNKHMQEEWSTWSHFDWPGQTNMDQDNSGKNRRPVFFKQMITTRKTHETHLFCWCCRKPSIKHDQQHGRSLTDRFMRCKLMSLHQQNGGAGLVPIKYWDKSISIEIITQSDFFKGLFHSPRGLSLKFDAPFIINFDPSVPTAAKRTSKLWTARDSHCSTANEPSICGWGCS